jgi:hypothetical protein
MSSLSKSFALILILIMVVSSVSLLMVKPANAQSIPKPSVPQFSINIAEHSYIVPEKISIDPYTGAKSTIPAYTVTNVTLTVTITNSPLATAYLLEVKGHYASDWDYLTMDYSMGGIINITAFAYSGAQTVITLSGTGDSQVSLGFSNHWSITVPSGGKLDFRLEAINGEVGSRVFGGSIYVGESSDWSNTQTVTVPASSTFTSTSPTPTVPEFPTLTILLVFIVLPLFSIVVLAKKHLSKITKS